MLCAQMLSMQGNTAVYLLYAHARIAGIIRKVRPSIRISKKTNKLRKEMYETARCVGIRSGVALCHTVAQHVIQYSCTA